MEILNIDSLATPATKKVAIAGKEYEVAETSVQDFIDFSKKTKELDDKPDTLEYERVENMMDFVGKLVPSCPREVLGSLDFNQLSALFQYCRGVMVKDIVEAFGGQGDSEEKKVEPTKKTRKPSR